MLVMMITEKQKSLPEKEANQGAKKLLKQKINELKVKCVVSSPQEQQRAISKIHTECPRCQHLHWKDDWPWKHRVGSDGGAFAVPLAECVPRMLRMLTRGPPLAV